MKLPKITLALTWLTLLCFGMASTSVVSAQVESAAPSEQQAPEGQVRDTMEMDSVEFFEEQYSHLVPHAIAGDSDSMFAFYDVNQYQLISLGIMAILFAWVLLSIKSRRPMWLIRVLRGWVMWLRDEVVYPVMGAEEGRAWAPYFIYLFFFIAICNLVSLVPGAATANATAWVTGTLALITFGMMMIGGMMKQGVGKFWVNLIPHGLPAWLLPLMIPLEVIGLLVKPFALTIRLFANMLAGHLVVYSFIGCIFLFAQMLELSWVSWTTAIPSLGLAVFIYIIEAFVALLQAYIFTYLSVIFIQQAMHPSH